MRQETGQSIYYYYSQTSSMWEQLFVVDPPLKQPEDIELFANYQDRHWFMHFMMSLCEDFEPTRASLLCRSPTPSLLWSRSSSPKRIIGLLITCHPLTMCWLHPLLPHSFPLLHSLLLHE